MSKSKIFLLFYLAFLVGVFVQSIFNFPQLLWLGILILGVVLAALFWHTNSVNSCECLPAGRHGAQTNKKVMVIGFCLIILAGGAWRFSGAADTERSITQFNDKGKVIFQGQVTDEPDIRGDNARYKIATSRGDILLVAKKYPTYNYGDVLEISGKLKTPQSGEDFDYARYLAKDDIYSVVYYPQIKLARSDKGNFIKAGLFWVKNKFENSISQILPEPPASLLAGLLLGEKRGFSAELLSDFSRTGTTHIIALSGYNITIIAVALMSVFNFFMLRRSISFWAAAGVIILFVLMTGASASAVRAAVMGILVLVAQQASRLYSIRNALIFAGALMVYFNPKVLTFDLGFQLSFAATLGLIYLSPILKRWIVGDETNKKTPKIILGLKEILIATLSAQIAVLPLLLINFGQLSLVAPLANVLILAFIPLTMFWGFLAGLAGIFWLGLGQILGWIAWLFLAYEIKTIELLARVPLTAAQFKWNWWGGGVYYVILAYLIWQFSRKFKM